MRTANCFVRSVHVLAAFAVGFGFAAQVDAAPSPNVYDGGNRWFITAYDDASPGHLRWATQGICFLPYTATGTHIRGVWYSDTFPNWRGRYSQEGDRILMHGDYAAGVGHDGMVMELFAGKPERDEAAGQWTEWRETGYYGTTIGFVNSRLRRVGSCRYVISASLPLEEIEKIAAEVSSRVAPRMLANGKVAESPGSPDQVPLNDEVESK